MKEQEYRVCSVTVMDSTDPTITFDQNGVSNHVYEYKKLASYLPPKDEAPKQLEALVSKIKAAGKGKEYDTILGISGGVDSSYMAYLAKNLGLRPLVIHFDNGWNSELAVKNIEGIIKKLGFDLQTYVIDWEEFKDVQMSFIKASVHNWEIPTDHAIAASLYKLAKKHGIKYILSGSNTVTEGILPLSWGYEAMDYKHLVGVHKKFGSKKLKSFPTLSLIQRFYHQYILGIESVRILNYVDYSKEKAMRVLQDELGWKYYGGKHYESIFTRFFQGYVLPTKFGVDKRKAHLSTLICSGQITRDEALEELKNDPYPSEKMLAEDKDFVLKKLDLTESDFEDIMNLPIKDFSDYPNSEKTRQNVQRLINMVKRIVRRNA